MTLWSSTTHPANKTCNMAQWNPWHGCTKISPGCLNCYVYRRDSAVGRDSTVVCRTNDFTLPIKRRRNGEYKLSSEDGTVYTCFTSDFFHPDADTWRSEAWAMIRERRDLKFFFVTKRPDRFYVSLPEDWGEGYPNVHICCTCENQAMADARLPLFLNLPIAKRSIIHEPMLEKIDISKYLAEYACKIESVTCGGESGRDARVCDYEWILHTRAQCVKYGVAFNFKQTGARFRKDGRLYSIERKLQQSQASRAGINFTPTERQ